MLRLELVTCSPSRNLLVHVQCSAGGLRHRYWDDVVWFDMMVISLTTWSVLLVPSAMVAR